MWKRDEAVKPGTPAGPGSGSAAPSSAPAATDSRTPPSTTTNEPLRGMERTTVNIGKSVVIKGELNGSEDLTIEGQVEGKIELRQNVLTIGPNGKIKAQVFAKSVIVLGEVTGNVTATEKVDIRDNGSVDGDIAAPRVAIAEGAHFRGSIDMQRVGAKPGDTRSDAKSDTKSDKPAASQSQPSGQSQPHAQPQPAGAGAAPQPAQSGATR
jgi:cytoskeletal protein CcmA (bactofilin family)